MSLFHRLPGQVNPLNNPSLTFLKTLYRLIDPNPNGSISMYDVGAEMDLDRDASNQTAQELMGDGLVEVRTLAGAIGITPAGLNLLITNSDAAPTEDVRLGTDGVTSPEAKAVLQQIADHLQKASPRWNAGENDRAELLADLETIRAQMVRPSRKTPFYTQQWNRYTPCWSNLIKTILLLIVWPDYSVNP